jgi:hypothetical protein
MERRWAPYLNWGSMTDSRYFRKDDLKSMAVTKRKVIQTVHLKVALEIKGEQLC